MRFGGSLRAATFCSRTQTPTKLSSKGAASVLHACRVLGLAEQNSYGVDRMYRELIRNGHEPPRIDAVEDEVAVNFLGTAADVRVARLLHELPETEREDTDVLIVLHRLVTATSVTAATVAPLIQRSEELAERVLRRMADQPADLVEATPGTLKRRHPNYRLRDHVVAALGPALRYRRRDRRELDRKVAEHIAEYGYVNNATLQRLFDVDVYAARDMLRGLVERALIVRTSTQSRGPAVRYGAGPAAETSSERQQGRRELAPQVVAHVREHGSIDNSALRELLDVDVYTARDMLRGLVDRGLIVRTSTQKRGSAVKYGPGPSFPTGRGRA